MSEIVCYTQGNGTRQSQFYHKVPNTVPIPPVRTRRLTSCPGNYRGMPLNSVASTLTAIGPWASACPWFKFTLQNAGRCSRCSWFPCRNATVLSLQDMPNGRPLSHVGCSGSESDTECHGSLRVADQNTRTFFLPRQGNFEPTITGCCFSWG